jgi:hypothetical protein
MSEKSWKLLAPEAAARPKGLLQRMAERKQEMMRFRPDGVPTPLGRNFVVKEIITQHNAHDQSSPHCADQCATETEGNSVVTRTAVVSEAPASSSLGQTDCQSGSQSTCEVAELGDSPAQAPFSDKKVQRRRSVPHANIEAEVDDIQAIVVGSCVQHSRFRHLRAIVQELGSEGRIKVKFETAPYAEQWHGIGDFQLAQDLPRRNTKRSSEDKPIFRHARSIHSSIPKASTKVVESIGKTGNGFRPKEKEHYASHVTSQLTALSKQTSFQLEGTPLQS